MCNLCINCNETLKVILMPTITLSVPTDLKQEMDEFKEMNWSEVARNAIREKIAQLKILKSISLKSKLSDNDAIVLGRKINRVFHERHNNG